MAVPYKTKLLLAYRCGDRCAICLGTLTPEGSDGSPINIGEAAHIAGEKETAARFDPSMTDPERDDYNNLIYVCSNCHTIIDDMVHGVRDYPVQRLLKIKAEHVRKARDAMTEVFASIGFPELEEATQWILHVQPSQSTHDFSLIPLEDKLKKNDLGIDSRVTITMGLSVAREVRAYVESVAQTDTDFPEKLKVGFLEEYFRLKRIGHIGDDLFDLMCQFAQRGFDSQAKRSAGLAVLIYLFEVCDVFEK